MSDNTVDWGFGVMRSNQDFVLISGPYCKECSFRKLELLKLFHISEKEELDELLEAKIKRIRVRCECPKK